MSYPGGKSGSGVYQTIINHIPPHDHYIEPFAGGAAIYEHLKQAERSTLIEKDKDQFTKLCATHMDADIIHGCGVWYIMERQLENKWTGREFIYADPPYVMQSRKSQRPIYDHEWDEDHHEEFIHHMKNTPCSIAISGYASELYFDLLSDWNVISFTAQTRRGPATEYLWMNYPTPTALHDASYLGADFRERERIKRKASRWADNFAAMPPLEQQAISSAMMNASRSLTALNDDGGFSPRQNKRCQLARYPIAISDEASA